MKRMLVLMNVFCLPASCPQNICKFGWNMTFRWKNVLTDPSLSSLQWKQWEFIPFCFAVNQIPWESVSLIDEVNLISYWSPGDLMVVSLCVCVCVCVFMYAAELWKSCFIFLLYFPLISHGNHWPHSKLKTTPPKVAETMYSDAGFIFHVII